MLPPAGLRGEGEREGGTPRPSLPCLVPILTLGAIFVAMLLLHAPAQRGAGRRAALPRGGREAALALVVAEHAARRHGRGGEEMRREQLQALEGRDGGAGEITAVRLQVGGEVIGALRDFHMRA